MAYPFQNLIFEGRGLQILCYLGALEVMEDKGIIKNIKRVCGTSFGALMALLVGLNYSMAESTKILLSLNSEQVFGKDFAIIRDSNRIFSHFGWNKASSLRDWVGSLIMKKTGNKNLTFHQLMNEIRDKGFRNMYFIGTNVATHFSEVFSPEHTPRVCIADAVCISMSLPLLYQPQRSLRGDPYIDGGLIDSYPVKLFDRVKYFDHSNEQEHGVETAYYKRLNSLMMKNSTIGTSLYLYNKETLSFRLDTPSSEAAAFRDQSEPQERVVDDFFDYTLSLINVMIEAQRNRHIHSDDWDRTIFIDTLGVRALDFGIADAQKKHLIQSGRHCTENYFKWYEDPSSFPANRV